MKKKRKVKLGRTRKQAAQIISSNVCEKAITKIVNIQLV